MYHSTIFPADKVRHITSTIHDGTMLPQDETEEATAIENRKKFFEANSITPTRVVSGNQTHSDGIHVVTMFDGGMGSLNFVNRIPDTDALITKEKNFFLLCTVADCAPISLYDPEHEVIAIAHCGWKGTDLRLIQKVVDTLRDGAGSDPEKLLVNIGPAIHKESYVGPLEHLTADVEERWGRHIEKTDTTYAKDNVGFNVSQLRQAGVREEHIEVATVDTYTSLDFFSYRRSRDTDEPQGRFVTLIGMIK